MSSFGDYMNNFITEENYHIIFPSKDMELKENLHALLRIFLYFTVIMTILKGSLNYIIFFIFAVIITYYMYVYENQNIVHEKMILEENNLKKDKRTNKVCVKPTKDNPLMNPTVADIVLNPERPEACDVEKADVKEEIEDRFSHNLYRDIDDVFNRQAWSRNWHTVPSTTIPNDQTSFAKWCWGINTPTCKEGNGLQCMANEYRYMKHA